ncbi:MAG: DNA mismatch repair protein MutS [Myxococcota bacterium]
MAKSQRQKSASPSRTPVMQQYFRAKEQYPDALLFFRLGDFYELFYDDAEKAAEILGITLTSRGQDKQGHRVPMAGVPHHAATGYLTKLLQKGHKIALCEQVGDPKKVRGIVPREVVRVITPGLCLEPDALESRAPNYLVAVETATEEPNDKSYGICAIDLSTCEVRTCSLGSTEEALAEVLRLGPKELIMSPNESDLLEATRSLTTQVAAHPFAEGFEEAVVARRFEGTDAGHQMGELPRAAYLAVLRAIHYADTYSIQRGIPVEVIRRYHPRDHLVLDDVAIRNLELVETLGGERRGSILQLIDKTRTPMGARTLRQWLLAPLRDVALIRRRHDVVALFTFQPLRLKEVQDPLSRVGDLERLATRASMGVATPKDLAALRTGLLAVESLRQCLAAMHDSELPFDLPEVEQDPSPANDAKRNEATVRSAALGASLPDVHTADLLEDLQRTLVEQPAATIHAGAIIAEGVDPELDELHAISQNSKSLIQELEQRERTRTGITTLKIKYTKVFGYYIEISKAKLGSVPEDYRRKQTVVGAERYTTDELAELQEKIAGADERSREIELALFQSLRERIGEEGAKLRRLAGGVGRIDALASLAEVARAYDYCRPVVDTGSTISLKDSRHPVVERLAAAGVFVPNDVELDADDCRLMMVTGPNMSGKSTTMRQVALAVILAQTGSFVPAKTARVGLVDRVFTRIGASDNLAEGHSTFMVEMQEAATVLREASADSLVILDEIGRGTSTYDGLAIAWAIAEHLHETIRCRTMFATHYHELCELESKFDGVRNYNVAALERGEEVVFLHRLTEGGANRSYGVAVARLAGIPDWVLERARSLLEAFENRTKAADSFPHGEGRSRESQQLDLFSAATPPHIGKVIETLRHLDPNQMTPMDALMALSRLKEQIEQED